MDTPRRRRLLPLALLLLLAPALLPPGAAAAAPPRGAERTAPSPPIKVIGIVDGDTLEVLRDGRSLRVRLFGVDCPERDQAFGTRARAFASDLAFGRAVGLVVRDADRYGRTVAEVILPDGRSLNRELLRAGYAWAYRRYLKGDGRAGKDYLALEAEARAARRGLWADADPTPPWEFRRKAPRG